MVGDKILKKIAINDNTKYREFIKECENDNDIIIVEDNEYFVKTKKPNLTLKEIKNIEINELRQFLTDTDDIALRLSTGEAEPTEISNRYNKTFAEVMEMRKVKRARLKELIEV